MKLLKTLGLAALLGGGYAAYKLNDKYKHLKETYNRVVSFSNERKEYIDFEGDSVAVVFGGLEIDLTKATIVGMEQTLKIYGEFCDIEIQVPEAWNVKVEGSGEKAGEDINVTFDPEDTTSPLLIIQYEVKYAGIEVSNMLEESTEVESQDDVETMMEIVED